MIGRWWRKNVRPKIKKLSPAKGTLWSKRLSLLYFFVTWNALGGALYLTFQRIKEKNILTPDEKLLLSPAEQLAKARGINSPKIIRIDGFHVRNDDQTSSKEKLKSELPLEETIFKPELNK